MALPFRHTFILIGVALATALLAVHGWRRARASASISGPIIIISIDTLRADHLPAYGYTQVKTPAIDALATDGVLFERAYSHAPQTLPSHVALLSGRLPFETGVRDNIGFTVKAGERMLAQMLRERGFATGGIVSAFVLRKETGINQGFDFFDGDMPPMSPELPIGQIRRDGTASEVIAERWLDTLGTSRAFLFLHLYEPHKPYSPPKRFAGYAPYDGEIAYADEIVGKFIKYLKSRQLYDRSMIVLLSDHGEGLGDHGEQEHGLFVYEEAIHVPLIIKQENNVGAGRRVVDLVQHIDLVPTILACVKAPVPKELRGRSLKPLLDGARGLPMTPVYSEAMYGRYHFGWSELTALTDDRYRYIKAPRDELYDLERDAHERSNIVDERQSVRQAMRGSLDRLTAGSSIQVPADVSPDARERLEALGYVGALTDVPTASGATLPDPKDKREILEKYRAAVDLAAGRQWPQAISLLQQILRADPEMADVWMQLAAFAIHADRYDVATDAYKHFIELKPSDAAGYLGAAATLLKQGKMKDAHDHAEFALTVATESDARSRASAHELLASIALARHDAKAATNEAEFARQADPRAPWPLFVAGRLLYDQGKFADALPSFERAVDQLTQPGAVQIGELHFYTADTLGRLERYPEAEAEFDQELRFYPNNARAWAGLAMIYQATGRTEAAERTIHEMVVATPTPVTYALAIHLLTMFGNPRQADALRSEARRASVATSRATASKR